MDRNLQFLGIARKAGMLVVGADASAFAARTGKAKAILTAGDASDGAKRRAERDAGFCGAAYISVPYTMLELGDIAGRGAPGTLAILDEGIANGFIKGLAECDSEK